MIELAPVSRASDDPHVGERRAIDVFPYAASQVAFPKHSNLGPGPFLCGHNVGFESPKVPIYTLFCVGILWAG